LNKTPFLSLFFFILFFDSYIEPKKASVPSQPKLEKVVNFSIKEKIKVIFIRNSLRVNYKKADEILFQSLKAKINRRNHFILAL